LKGFCDGIMGVSYSDLANGTLYDIQESDGCLFFKKIRACALDGHHPSSRLYNLAEIIFSYRYNP
ncbi:MAG: hypothetical protein J5855_08530, partial [Mailhella sp.]|nr:hypothetical protein [Mailhella sp.]